ncbi:MAG: hypothetical protein QME62_14180, partial [Armatimonadota bacterium]|nr:hypothetical protein [Armatimonadota bacterium]
SSIPDLAEYLFDGEKIGLKGKIEKIIACKGSFVNVGDIKLSFFGKPEFIEVALEGNKVSVVSGREWEIDHITVGGIDIGK